MHTDHCAPNIPVRSENMGSVVGPGWSPPGTCTQGKATTRQGFRGVAGHAGCGLGSHPNPREEATAFSEPGDAERESSSCLRFPWELEGVLGEVSLFCAQLGMSWWRIFLSKQREFSSPPCPRLPLPPPYPLRSPPVLWATLVSSLGLSFCTQLMWRARIWPIQTPHGTLCVCHSASRNMILSNRGKTQLAFLSQ